MEEEQLPEKQDMVDRKAAWIERMFDKLLLAIQKNPIATMLILSIGLNFWQFNIGAEKDRLRIRDITTLSEKINIAVERSVDKKLPEKLVLYREQQDSTNARVDTSLSNLNETVESVKRYFNKKK